MLSSIIRIFLVFLLAMVVEMIYVLFDSPYLMIRAGQIEPSIHARAHDFGEMVHQAPYLHIHTHPGCPD